MGAIKDLKTKVFGDFMQYMKHTIKDEDPFSNDVWAGKIFDHLHKQYEDAIKSGKAINNFLNNMSIADVENLLKAKQEIEAKKQANNNGGKTLAMPDKRIVDAKGRPVRKN